VAGLVLEPLEVAGPLRWRWLLRTEEGEALASHQVALPAGDYEHRGFTDLYRFLRWQADPDRRVVSEAQLTAQVGDWIGRQALGEPVLAALLDEAPVTVRVPVPAELAFLPYRPWEIAAGGGLVLGREQVRFVFDLAGTRRPPRRAVAPNGPALRLLGLFSAPAGGSVLGLRRERYALDQLIRQLGQGQQPRAVQLRVLQYGVTRAALTAAVDDEDGWDVVHLSGHGAAGVLLLEHPDGSPDSLDSADLVELLFPMRRRLRLVVLSACESGAATAAETLRLLDLAEQAAPLDTQADQEADATAEPDSAAGWPGLGRALVERLGCAVLAMRYPVVDDFAIELAGQMYRGLFEHGQPVDVALARALPRAAPLPPSVGAPAVSLATPALLGPAAGLRLPPPAGRLPVSLAMAGFAAEPPRFVGRSPLLTQARHALLVGSGRAGVLLYGMAGAGKTTSALELAYQTHATFTAAAFWQAPPADQWATALASLAQALETQLNPALNPDQRPELPTLQLVDKLVSDTALDRYRPRLTELVEQTRLLLVLDNLESLLSAPGTWLDPRFGRLLAALTGHAGASRVLLTSRTVPAGLDPARVPGLAVHTLTRDESLLLARELPHLRALQHDTEPATRDVTTAVRADRALLARTLAVVQGHPKLLELADAAAADPAVLNQRVTAAEAAASERGAPLTAFLATGSSELDPDQLLAALTGWTHTATAALPDPARLLLQLLAAVEPEDRTSSVLEGNWADLWTRLARPGDPPPLADTLQPLLDAALTEPEPLGAADQPDRPVRYRIHPGVADTVRAATAPELLTAVDTELAAYWTTVFTHAQQREQQDRAGWLIVHAALAATPYLLRRQHWDTAGTLLEQALHRDESPGTVGAVLPPLRRIAAATVGTDGELGNHARLARAVARVDPDQAEQQLRDLLATAIDRRQYRTASAAAGDLINLLRGRGRFVEALALVDQRVELTRQAGLGPWSQLLAIAQRLQLLAATGDTAQVLAEVERLRERMRALPAEPGANEVVDPWNVREVIFDTGREAALALGRWQDALDLNAEVLASERRRGAGPHEIAGTAFNDYSPLLSLRRLDRADRLLRHCQEVFEAAVDTERLGKVLSARADLANRQGYPGPAAHHEQAALRYHYVHSDPEGVAASHHNLANYLRAGAAPEEWLAHRLAATLLYRLTGMTRDLQDNLRQLARELADPAAAAAAPTTIDQVRQTVERVDGVRFGALLDALQPDAGRQQGALDDILHTARTMPADQATGLDRHLDQWEPVLAAILAATTGDQGALQQVDGVLDRYADTRDWAALAGVLRRILAGDRDPETLLADLDPVDTAIVTRLLDALAGRVQLSLADPPEPSDER